MLLPLLSLPADSIHAKQIEMNSWQQCEYKGSKIVYVRLTAHLVASTWNTKECFFDSL